MAWGDRGAKKRGETFEDLIDEDPPSIDPYAILGLETEASPEEVKKAYRKLALQHHPDKVAEADKSTAHAKFQEIAFAYAVLSDERRRKRFDLTGSTEEILHDDDDFDWLSFYREQFEDIVNEENIKKIADEYKGGPDERKSVINAYTRCTGDLDKMYELIMLSDIFEDDDRFRKIIDEEIVKGTVESYPAYERANTDEFRERAKEAERKRREKFAKTHGSTKDAAEKVKAKQKGKGQGKQNGDGDLGALAALIQGRQRARMGAGFFEQMEAKYAEPAASGKGRKKAAPKDDGPTEEEFLAARARVEGRSKGRQGEKRATPMDDEATEEKSRSPRKRVQTGGRSSRATTQAMKKDMDEDEEDDDDDESSENLGDDSDDSVSESEEEPTPPPKRKRGTATPVVKGRGRAKKVVS